MESKDFPRLLADAKGLNLFLICIGHLDRSLFN